MATAGPDPRLAVVTLDLDDLVTRAWRGEVRIPHFQRDFRWNQQDVIRLFDSVARGFPIGNLLFWERPSPAGVVSLGGLEIDARASDHALWVVDGRQRITSLANALHPEGNRHAPFNIGYDLADRVFVPEPAAGHLDYLPLSILFDLTRLFKWLDEHRGNAVASEYFAEAVRLSSALRDFSVPAYLVRQGDEQTLITIFDRLNSYGKRLRRAETFSALFAGSENGADGRRSVSRIVERVASETGFGTLDEGTVLAALLSRRGPDPSREIRDEFDETRREAHPDFPAEGPDAAFAEGERALARAILFLRESAGVPHVSMLSYRAALVVLTRFFAHFPEPAQRNINLLRRFYWRVSVSGPSVFKGSSTTMIRTLSARIIPGSESRSIDGLLETMKDSVPTLPNPARFRTNEVGGRIILGSWWALGPRSPLTGETYGVHELSDLLADQVTAAAAVRRIYRRDIPARQQLWSANRLFVPSESDPVDDFFDLFSRIPPDFTETAWRAVLASYSLTPDVVALHERGDRHGFLDARQGIVSTNLSDFLGRMTEWDMEDTPPLASLIFDDPDDLDEVED